MCNFIDERRKQNESGNMEKFYLYDGNDIVKVNEKIRKGALK